MVDVTHETSGSDLRIDNCQNSEYMSPFAGFPCFQDPGPAKVFFALPICKSVMLIKKFPDGKLFVKFSVCFL